MSFDLSKYEVIDSAPYELQDVRGNPLLGDDGKPVVVVMSGPGSVAYTKAQLKLERDMQLRTFGMMRGKTSTESVEETRRPKADKLAACTVSISDNFPLAPLDLYMNPKLGYLANQLERFADEWANFPPAS